MQREFGSALQLAQIGARHSCAEVFRGFRSAGALEVVENFSMDTYPAVYTVRFSRAVYVFHGFKKTSAKGIETPRPDIELIRNRFDETKRMSEGD